MKTLAVFGFATCLAVAPAVYAEQMYSNDGVGMAQSMSKAQPISDGHVVVHANSQYSSLETNDSSNPLNGASGPCFGSFEIMGPKVNGSGHCLYTDKQGDTAILSWSAEGMTADGKMHGNWQLTGGNGKYVGGSGGGEYQVSTNQETGAQTNNVTGAITLK